MECIMAITPGIVDSGQAISELFVGFALYLRIGKDCPPRLEFVQGESCGDLDFNRASNVRSFPYGHNRGSEIQRRFRASIRDCVYIKRAVRLFWSGELGLNSRLRSAFLRSASVLKLTWRCTLPVPSNRP